MTTNGEKDYDKLVNELQREYLNLVATLKSLEANHGRVYKTMLRNREQMDKLTAGRSNRVSNQPTPPMPLVPRVLNVRAGTVVLPQNQYQTSQLLSQQQQQQQQQQTTVMPVTSTATPTTMRPQVQMTKNEQMSKLMTGCSNGVGNQPTPPMPAVPRVLNVNGGLVVLPQNKYQMSQLVPQQQQQQQQTTVRPVASTVTPTTLKLVASTATPTTMRPQVQMPTNEQMSKLMTGCSNRVGNQPTPQMLAVSSVLNVGGGPVVLLQNQYQMSQLLPQQQQQQQTTVRPVVSIETPITVRPQVQMPKNSGLSIATVPTGIAVPTIKLQPVSLDHIKKMVAVKMQATTNEQQTDSTSSQNPKRKANNGADFKLGSQITITQIPAPAKKIKPSPTKIVSNDHVSILPKPTTTSDSQIVEVTGSGKMDETDSQTVEKIDRRTTKLACRVDSADTVCNPIRDEQGGSDIEILEEFSTDKANNSIKVKTEPTEATVKPKNVDKPSKRPQKGNN
ncbi:E1A-binding protein p400-like isoform X1 [Trichogramma pretiosum]|uniref:E1A-binding protein p400-like isoform X1 n=1 Tax=Trichogramma pretiosum TaxID=7493 RepID=UPI000C719F68|nr:E1A-binding protein p400-like isoform X1 [Trichogramma pretiosum]